MSLPNTDQILEDLDFFDSWEERYKYIIDLGKTLPTFPEELHTPERLVKGCQSNVWLEVNKEGDKLSFLVDSDAIIVKGLLVLVLAAYDKKTAQEIIDFDIDDYFAQLDLERHISPTRGNGLKAIVGKIQAIASACLR
ncbi:SufE family protein [Alteromonas sp. a30]|uniref:SufE family protein n=1 Tax=Alteromonas sp. a30 TaxID=2730917 RepID=UPI00227E3457|nr:SufE family protein [Alteromonas sp. a30]MCY7296407.1 SufE family protein [Alteromonas sp. a30]